MRVGGEPLLGRQRAEILGLGAAAVAAAALLGCYDPSYPRGLDCQESQRCPPGQMCVGGTCQLETDPDGGAGDGGVAPSIGTLSLGARHACAVTESVPKRLRCWGETARGRLGIGESWEDPPLGDDETPQSVGLDTEVAALSEGEVTQLALGIAHSCARIVDGSSRAIRCWGEHDGGKLGYGSAGDEDVGDDETPAEYRDGVFVPIDGSAVQIAAGSNHTCAILDTEDLEGRVRCWGSDGGGRGVLGYGGTGCEGDLNVGDVETPDECSTIGLDRAAVAIAAGSRHTCVILDSGFVQCWGEGEYGALQADTTEDVGDNEAPVSFSSVMVNGAAQGLALGSRHTCVRTGGDVLCWGDASERQLGPATQELRRGATNFVQVDLPGDAVQIAAGAFHTCARLEGGDVHCWGRNACGELGRARSDRVIANPGPDAVELGGPAMAIAAGTPAGEEGSFTCALLAGGEVRCWGDASSGQLGYGDAIEDDCVGDEEGERPVDLGSVKIF